MICNIIIHKNIVCMHKGVSFNPENCFIWKCVEVFMLLWWILSHCEAIKNNTLHSQNTFSVLCVSRYLSFPSFSSVLHPTPQPLCFESVLSTTQLRRDPVVKITDVFPSFLSFRWDGLTTPCCPFLPPPLSIPHSLSPSPTSHTLTPHLSCSFPCTPHM